VTAIQLGTVLASGYWDTQAGAPSTAPGPGKYRADNWAAPTLVALATTDADGYDRSAGLAAVVAGALITQQGTNDSQNYQRWTVGAVTPLPGYVQLAVTVAEQGSAFVPPGSNQRRLLQALAMSGAPPADPWRAWAPPLNPPTPGGLDETTATNIADATWATDPHLCAALQWEAYAAQLPPSPAVSQVATGAQSVTYSPPMPGGDAGAAMARAAWHRSLMGSGGSAELVQSPPALPSAPGTPWPVYDPAGSWWAVA